MSMFDLSGRVAVVTGGNGGIGFGMAKGLAEAGASIVVAGRNPAKNQQAVAELSSLGATALAVEGDIRKEADCEALIERAAAHFGRLDILINNAGINYRRPPETYSRSDWRDVIETNLTSAFVCSQAAYPHFLKAGGGKIITIGSMTSIFGVPFAVAYASSKGGIVQMTKSLAVAWGKDNVQANAILPGWIDTDLTRRARTDVPGLHDRVLARTPAGRWGAPADFAGIAVFLASGASDFVSGAAITVDGGFSVSG